MTGTLAEAFDRVARRAGARPATVAEEGALSYEQLLRWSEAISLQIGRHTELYERPVALVLPNSAAFVASFFGVARAGGIVAPLNVGYRSQELVHYLADIDPAVVLVCDGTARGVLGARERLERKPMMLLVETPGEAETLAPGDGAERPCLPEPDALLLLHTSGSTGHPKRVVRTHAQLLAEVEALRTLFAMTTHDRSLGVAPFSHVNGLVRSMLTSMLTGATLYPIQRFAPRPVAELITRERLTFFGGVPQMFALLAQTPRRGAADLSSLRILFSSSAPLTPEANRSFHRAYGLFVRQLYGSTETGTISYNDHPEVHEHLESVGRPLPGVTLAVLDNAGRPLQSDEEGEVAVSSPLAISHYAGNAVASRRSFRGGLYLTGDLGRLAADGYLTLTGRESLMINRGGYKVNPHEVEEAIRRHPKVADVAVFGAPGPLGDQIVHSIVVTSAACSAEEIVRHCQDLIADYKIPSRIEFRKRLPRTTTGKIRRENLRPRST